MPSRDQPIGFQNLLLEPAQLCAEYCETRASYRRNPTVGWIGDDMEQFLDALAPDRRNDSELGKMGTDRINH